jgi:hypothetical protein
MTRTNLKQASVANPQKWFQRRRRWHDPMLVWNMSIFNFDGGWNRIFNPLPQRETSGEHTRLACRCQSGSDFRRSRRKARFISQQTSRHHDSDTFFNSGY